MIDLSILIVNINTKKLTLECIKSVISKTKGIEHEIIVIDNGSKDGSVEVLQALASKHKSVNIITNKTNLGFAKANNQGIKKAKGEFVLLLNSDTLVKSNTLGEMVKWMRDNKQVGVASCALINPDGSLQGTGGYFPNLFKVFAWMFFVEDIPLLDRIIRPFHPAHSQSFFYKGESYFREAREQDWVTGAYFLIRREVIESVGDIDEDYFMYTEEVDWCYRIKRAGWKVWYLPKWSIVHIGGASTTAEFPILAEYQSIQLFYKKHKDKWQLVLLRVFLKGGALARIVLFGILKGKEVARTYAKAYKIA